MKGKRYYAKSTSRHKVRVSKIAALREKNIFDPYVFTGYCNRDLFEAYIENIFLPELDGGDVVIMDNVSFHKTDAV